MIANPLDDEVLFGALASPACRGHARRPVAAARRGGTRRHVWPASSGWASHSPPRGSSDTPWRAKRTSDAELAAPERLEQIPAAERELLGQFVATIAELRRHGGRLPLAGLVEAAIGETGYDLATLLRPAGEARFANVRKLMRLAEGFEAREGRDLRGLLDFLFARAEADAEAEAASAVEGHDGVRVMTVHTAKGLEFGVVAVPNLSRRLLAGRACRR